MATILWSVAMAAMLAWNAPATAQNQVPYEHKEYFSDICKGTPTVQFASKAQACTAKNNPLSLTDPTGEAANFIGGFVYALLPAVSAGTFPAVEIGKALSTALVPVV